MSKQEIIQYAKDVYSSKSVNYIIDSQGQNSRYRYAMVVRQNKYIQLFYNRKNHDLLQFERTKEGLQLTRSTSEKTSSSVLRKEGFH